MIGIFDSGSGGLSVASVLRKQAPHADILYFGDIANAPYGEMNQQQLTELSENGIQLLKAHGATVLLSACNSVSSAVLAGAAKGMPFVEMSVPTATFLKSEYRHKRLLLIATPATIESGLYIHALGGEVEIDSLPIPGLAGVIEFGGADSEIKALVEEAFMTRKGDKYDGVLLGCTHYPLGLQVITELTSTYFGPIPIIDPAYPVVEDVLRKFPIKGQGTTTFLISKENLAFRDKVKELFPDSNVSIQVL